MPWFGGFLTLLSLSALSHHYSLLILNLSPTIEWKFYLIYLLLVPYLLISCIVWFQWHFIVQSGVAYIPLTKMEVCIYWFAHLLMSNGQCDCSSQFLTRKIEVFQIFQRGFNNTGNWLQRWWRGWGAQNTKYSKISNRRSPRGDQGKGCHQGSCSLNLAAEQAPGETLAARWHGSCCCAAQSWKIK